MRTHTDRNQRAQYFASPERKGPRLTLAVGARVIRTGRARSPNGAAIFRSALFTEGIPPSGPL